MPSPESLDPAADTAGAVSHWFEPIATTLGSAYLRYTFTLGTDQECTYLSGVLGLRPGSRVLDVGCGPGRHARRLAADGVVVHGIDISERFVELAAGGAPASATFERVDARCLVDRSDLHDRFDAVICLCQGAFGMMRVDGDDARVLEGIARCVRPGGRVAVSAFNAYYAARYHDEATFDADAGVTHEVTEIRDERGGRHRVDLWTGCYTPRELRLLLGGVGLEICSISGAEPGDYGAEPASLERPEHLVIAERPV